MHNLLINEKCSVLIVIEPGKLGKDGKRKNQKAQKGFTCFFETMKTVQGDYNSSEYTKSHSPDIQTKIKTAKKSIEKFSLKYGTIIGSLNVLNSKPNGKVNDENIDHYIKYYESRLKPEMAESQRFEIETMLEFFKQFKQRTNKKLSAIEFAKGREAIEQKLIYTQVTKALNIVPEEYYQKIFPHESKDFPWQSLEPMEQRTYLSSFIQKACYDLYPLIESNWHPNTSSFEDLLNILRTKGAVITGGKIGRAYYKDEPESYTHTSNKHTFQVLGWREDQYDPSHAVAQSGYGLIHSIILVGGNVVDGKPVLYYIDPLDESPVDKPRKVYTISYNKFIESVCSLQGVWNSDLSQTDKSLLYDPGFRP